MTQRSPRSRPARHRLTAVIVMVAVVAMVGMAYAAVPLYRMFCQATGYGGTTQVAKQDSATHGARTLTVRFDTNVAAGLPWTFEPDLAAVSVRTGVTTTAFFKVKNTSSRPWAGTAAFNVSPDQAGAYFMKIACFCFSEQHLDPGEVVEWPVVFYLDPDLETDETMNDVGAVTLSYTFFPSKVQPSAQVSATDSKAAVQ